MKNKLEIDLGRDGVPDGTPPSAWIEWDGEKFRFEVENYMEKWYVLDKENTDKHFYALGAKDDADFERVLRNRFTQSPKFKNFDMLDKFVSLCREHNIKYSVNAWLGRGLIGPILKLQPPPKHWRLLNQKAKGKT